MAREYWKPSNMLYPVPAVMISCADENGRANIMTAAWTGTVCSDPVMLSVSIRPERYSHDIIERTGEFVVNLTTKRLAFAADWCGVRSGRNYDKFREMHLTRMPCRIVKAPGIAQSPVCLECRVRNILHLGSHDMFIAEVVSTDIDDQYVDQTGKLNLDKAGLLTYSHGEYFSLGDLIGKFGYSVEKKGSRKRAEAGRRELHQTSKLRTTLRTTESKKA